MDSSYRPTPLLTPEQSQAMNAEILEAAAFLKAAGQPSLEAGAMTEAEMMHKIRMLEHRVGELETFKGQCYTVVNKILRHLKLA